MKPRELARRLPDAYEDPFNARISGSKQQVASISLKMFEENFGSLCTRLHLDRAIVDHNLSRMKDIIDLFISKYRAYLRSYVGEQGLLARADTLKFFTQHEMCLAFEFYLAMDGKNLVHEAHYLTFFFPLVDVFYMKSCAFRGAQPRPSVSVSFFDDETPAASYDLSPCHRSYCVCCQAEPCEMTRDSASSVSVTFSEHGHMHRFVNGYETILNCPAV